MERLVINIPERKSTLIKQILKGLGVTIQQESQSTPSAYKQKLTKVTIWSDEDLSVFEESKKAFEDLKPQQSHRIAAAPALCSPIGFFRLVRVKFSKVPWQEPL